MLVTVGKAVNHAGLPTLYLTPMHGKTYARQYWPCSMSELLRSSSEWPTHGLC